ncbi:MAG: hypothetical protein HZC01_02845 [Candidatus Kerfeldbacteria bacterium]|nr:hypothetical protein [Candidatus Kerfeldbacteria bacterium]
MQRIDTCLSVQMDELMAELLNGGVSYRYTPNRFEALTGGGHPYPSPTRQIETPTGPMIEEAIQPVLSPIILEHTEYYQLKRLAAAWPRWLNAQMAIVRRARQGELAPEHTEQIHSLCTKNEWECALIDPGYQIIHPFVRLDAIRTPDGFKVMDINTTRPAGVGDLITATDFLNQYNTSYLLSFPTRRSFTDIVQRCINQWSSYQRLPGESIRLQVVIRSDDGDWRNFKTIADCLTAAGIPSTIVAPDEIQSGAPTAIIRGRIKEGDPAYHLLLPGYPDERCILSPLHRRFLGNKVWMYLFRIEPYRTLFLQELGTADYQLLDSHFAEIGFVQGDQIVLPDQSVPLQYADKHDWVLKDPTSSSGRRMILGYTMSDQKWKQSLWNDVQNGWIAQRFYTNVEERLVADPSGQPMPQKLFTKYGIYIFGDQLGGLEFHARTHPVVHGARNAYFNPVFRVNHPPHG